ncbi:MAG: sterol desaturase family protein [Candidatus Kapaibacterium sp.]
MAKLYVSNKDESARIFKSDFLEFFSKVHWTVPIIFYVPFILLFLYLGLYSYEIGWGESAVVFLAGIVVWSIVEYLLHRFLFHYHPKSEWAKKVHWTFHGVHHDYPQDSKRLVMPPAVSIPLALLFYLLFNALFGTAYNMPFFAGFLTGYVAYDTIHYAIHHFAFKNKIMLALKQHHMKHHYVEPDEGFGVSLPLWDHVFGTTYTVDKKKTIRQLDNHIK